MKYRQTIGKWLCGGCVCYTLLSVFFLILGTALSGSGYRVNTFSFLMMLPCAFLLSFANLLLMNRRQEFWLRALLHYLITTVSVFLFLWLPAGVEARGSTVLILAVAFSVVYWILFFLIRMMRRRILRLLSDD